MTGVLHASPIQRTCEVCGAKPGHGCTSKDGSGRPTKTHAVRTGTTGKETYAALKANRRCVKCRMPVQKGEGSVCAGCLARFRDHRAKDDVRARDRLRRQALSKEKYDQGKCRHCEEPRLANRVYCTDHAANRKRIKKRYWFKRRTGQRSLNKRNVVASFVIDTTGAPL